MNSCFSSCFTSFSWIAGVSIVLATSTGYAQNFQPRSGRTSVQQSRPSQSGAAADESSPSVSSDLLQLYALTKTVKSELEVTSIARSCSTIIPDTKRSQVDRDYASSLLSWALNRRGEMRSEQAAQLVEQGQLAAAAKLDKFATDDLATAVEYGPNNWRTRHNLAIALAMKGEYENAIAQFDEAIKLKSDYPNALFNRGELYFELQDYARAFADYSAAIELNSSDPQYYNSRAHAQFMRESYEEAISDYRRATELGADSAVYMTDLADAYQFLGAWEDAATAYRAALKLNNQLPRAYQNVAWLMATCPVTKIRNAELALAAANKALELNGGETPELLDVLAAATAASGNYQEAAKLQSKAVAATCEASERSELQQRLALYQRKRAYVQADQQRRHATITVSTR